jgi:hypothetical protein
VSKKLPGMRLVPIKLEIRRKAAAEGAQAFQQLLPSGLTSHEELTRSGGVNLGFGEQWNRKYG